MASKTVVAHEVMTKGPCPKLVEVRCGQYVPSRRGDCLGGLVVVARLPGGVIHYRCGTCGSINERRKVRRGRRARGRDIARGAHAR